MIGETGVSWSVGQVGPRPISLITELSHNDNITCDISFDYLTLTVEKTMVIRRRVKNIEEKKQFYTIIVTF